MTIGAGPAGATSGARYQCFPGGMQLSVQVPVNCCLSGPAQRAPPALQLTLLQKLVQQSVAAGEASLLASLTPYASPPDSRRTSAPSATPAASATLLRSSTPLPLPQGAAQPPASAAAKQQEQQTDRQAQRPAEQQAEQHWGLARAVDCFRCGSVQHLMPLLQRQTCGLCFLDSDARHAHKHYAAVTAPAFLAGRASCLWT